VVSVKYGSKMHRKCHDEIEQDCYLKTKTHTCKNLDKDVFKKKQPFMHKIHNF